METLGGLIGVIVGLGFAVLIIWLIRELITWYLKIDKRINLIEKQVSQQDTIIRLLNELIIINKKTE